MANVHPIYHKPTLHCGRCHNVMMRPLRKDEEQRLIDAGQPVLVECGICGVAVEAPAELFSVGPVHRLETIEARPWKKN